VVELVKGSEAWRYDTICALCRCVITSEEDVYVAGSHVFHKKCLDWLLSKTEGVFEEILNHLPLDTHEELKELYRTKVLPKPEVGLVRAEQKTETPNYSKLIEYLRKYRVEVGE